MVTGAAPISTDIKNFFKIAMCCPMVEAYGQTEVCGTCHITDTGDPTDGHVGGPVKTCEYKLEDVSDMEYYAFNPEQNFRKFGDNQPRGEILVRSPQVIPCYFKLDKKTRETIDEDGWLHTGDIGLYTTEGCLKIIDRKKNIMKIANGEYIAPEKIENVYVTHPMVTEAFIDGKSTEEYIVGFIVPDKKSFMSFAQENGQEGTFEALCKNEEVLAAFHATLKAFCKSKKLHGFEVCKQFKLITTPFEELGLQTNSFKLKRNKARQHFADDIEELYTLKRRR